MSVGTPTCVQTLSLLRLSPGIFFEYSLEGYHPERFSATLEITLSFKMTLYRVSDNLVVRKGLVQALA